MHMAAKVKPWTIEDLHRLPDDGNKYELVRGVLFVTPSPTVSHETILARLTRVLEPYVVAQGLGLVYHPRAVVQFEGSEVEPDLMVRQAPPDDEDRWDHLPIPSLVVEVASQSTRRRDRNEKREFYLDAGVGEYWIVDRESATVTSVAAGRPDVVAKESLSWRPPETSAALELRLTELFGRDPLTPMMEVAADA